jgi:ribosomal protein S27E
MPSNTIRFLNSFAGGLLLAVAAALFFSSRVGADIVLPRDPIFAISIGHLFSILSGICLGVALFTLSGKPTFTRAMVIAWLATNLAAYCLGCLWNGGHSLGGYLGSFSDAFGVSAATAGIMAEAALADLVLASYFMLIGLWLQNRRVASGDYLKISCPSCGGHVTFASQNLGQRIPCPHCKAVIMLRKPDLLKMTCCFCKEHIEFPAHALGQKISCPHCKMDITLKESA